jgi:type VI secretion system protein ImpG
MADELLTHYERELTFLRQMGAEFALKYPKIASRLQIAPDQAEDPHVERLIQAFAFLAARIHNKIEDEFPEITDALLGVLYPHYLAPIPSMAIAQFVPDPDPGKLTSAHRIESGAMLYSQPVGGTPCRFRTCYPVTLWPIEVASAQVDSADRLGASAKAVAAIRLKLRCVSGTTFAELRPDRLRFYLHGEGEAAYSAHELLFNNVCEVHLRASQPNGRFTTVKLSPRCLRPVGFSPDESMLPYTPRSFQGYRVLQEYFALPEKFLFFDLLELDRAVATGCREDLEVLIFLDQTPRLERSIGASMFRLSCSPIINLFAQIAEPVRISHALTEYRVIADVRRQDATEVYSVESVASTSPYLPEPIEFQPFYSFRHAIESEERKAFWYATRRPSPRKGDAGSEVYLSLVDLDFRPTVPPVETLTLHTTCTNRDLPGKLPFGGERGDLELEGAAPLSRIRCLTKPTPTVRPPARKRAQWRLISHLALNYLSVCEGGREALQEILKLYDFEGSSVIQQQIAGIVDVQSRRVVRRPATMPWNGFCRGLEVTITFDEEKYVGSSAFLFASVLERFLGLYASLNSFSQLIARTRRRQEPLKRWPPRAGEQILL